MTQRSRGGNWPLQSKLGLQKLKLNKMLLVFQDLGLASLQQTCGAVPLAPLSATCHGAGRVLSLGRSGHLRGGLSGLPLCGVRLWCQERSGRLLKGQSLHLTPGRAGAPKEKGREGEQREGGRRLGSSPRSRPAAALGDADKRRLSRRIGAPRLSAH